MPFHITKSLTLAAVLALTGCEPSTQQSATQPATSQSATTAPSADKPVTKGIVGTWEIDVERSVKDLTEIPQGFGYNRKFESLDAYRAFVMPKIEGGIFEIKPGGKAVFRSKQGSRDMTWEQQGQKFWVGNHIYMSASIGHIFEIKDAQSGICRFQMEYSESVAPRSPLYVTKVSD